MDNVNTITPNILEKNGYREYKDHFKDKSTYLGSWQKFVSNEYGKAYCINFTFSDLSMLYKSSELKKFNPINCECDLQFHDFDDTVVNVKIFSINKNLEQLEEFIEKMFNKMRFRNTDYYSNEDEEYHKYNILKSKKEEEVDLLKESLIKKKKKKI